MAHELQFAVMSQDILDVLHHHGLTPDSFNINLVVSRDTFEKLVIAHPEVAHPCIILVSAESNGLRWSLQILPRRTLEDFPPRIIIAPPE